VVRPLAKEAIGVASTMQHLATNVEAMVVIKKNAVVASVQMEDFAILF